MRQHFVVTALAVSVGLVVGSVSWAATPAKKKSVSEGDVFYVYTEGGSRLNHYIPSGWMGDYGDLRMDQRWSKGVGKPKLKEGKAASKAKAPDVLAEDKTCIRVIYTAERKQGAGWGGVYWQYPQNNWGDKKGGYDLTGYNKLTFWAKGEKGDEVVDKFFMGGITGQTEEGDSDEASISPVKLTKEWQKFEIPLTGLDLSHIVGGFGFASNADANPEGFTVYIDEIRYEK
ncbi:MAG: hypothetical protein LHV69_03285 [Elusimicrobia bacterium]|nr:hypothetical protein [Candidatus Obscuribacterium magneticum]